MKDNQHEQLFTDLTSEEAAVIEGGATLRLARIECLKASSDPVGGDEPYINVNGQKVWSGSMEQGSTRTINKSVRGGSSFLVSMYDDDPWPNPDDPIASKYLTGSGVARFSSNNSTYNLYYTIA